MQSLGPRLAMRLAALEVAVGDRVDSGVTLARFADTTQPADLAAARTNGAMPHDAEGSDVAYSDASVRAARSRAEVRAEAIAASPAFSIAGGGDTLAAIDKYGVAANISYISTGGGAFLEFVEGKVLPAVEVLEQRAKV